MSCSKNRFEAPKCHTQQQLWRPFSYSYNKYITFQSYNCCFPRHPLISLINITWKDTREHLTRNLFFGYWQQAYFQPLLSPNRKYSIWAKRQNYRHLQLFRLFQEWELFSYSTAQVTQVKKLCYSKFAYKDYGHMRAIPLILFSFISSITSFDVYRETSQAY